MLFISDKLYIIINVIMDMIYYYKILDVIGIVDFFYINIYVGGVYGNKEKVIECFYENIKKFFIYIKK